MREAVKMETTKLVIWISVLVMPCSASWEESLLTKAILAQLQRNMSHVTRPSLAGGPVEVEMSVELLDIRDMSKKTSIGELYVEETYMWHEPRIQWEPSEFPDVHHLHIPAESVWTPDVFMVNDESLHPDELAGQVTVTWEGHVTWTPRVIHKTQCTPTKPFSRRNRMPDWQCRLEYQSKDYRQEELTLMHTNHDGVDVSSVVENAEWDVKRTGVKRTNDGIVYIIILKEIPYVRQGEEGY